MISKETYDKMQEYKALGLSMLKATEKLGISYNTTYKWWNKTDEEFTSFQKEHEFVLDNYRQYIIQQLKLCPQINHTLILRRLKEEFPDFEIPTSTFFRYMKKLREQTGIQKPTRKGAIRDELKPGYEGQADYGQYVMQKYYTEEQIHIGMQHCNLVGICTVMELSSFLLYRFGEETARRYLHHSSYKTYLLRANEIREEQNNG